MSISATDLRIKIGSLIYRAAVTKTQKEIDHFIQLAPLWFRGLSGIWSVSGSFYANGFARMLTVTNDTNLLRFNIRDIRLFVSFVILTRLLYTIY